MNKNRISKSHFGHFETNSINHKCQIWNENTYIGGEKETEMPLGNAARQDEQI